MSNDLPLVSIATAALDPPLDKLVRCIESVEAQGYPRIEHVIVDGGSTNGALEILRQHEQLHWISEPDRGQCDAMNKAIFEQSKGELIVWLNADDVLHPGAVEHAAALFGEDPELGWVYGNLDVDRRGHKHVIHPPREATIEALAGCRKACRSPRGECGRACSRRAS